MSEITELIGEKLNGQTLSSIMWSLEKKIGSRITDLEQVGHLVNRELFGQVFSGKNGDKYRFAGIEQANSKKTLVTSPKSHGQFGKHFLSTKMDDYLPLSTTKNMISN